MSSSQRRSITLQAMLQADATAPQGVADWLRRRAVTLVEHYRGQLLHSNGLVTASFGSAAQVHARRALRTGWAIRSAAIQSESRYVVAVASGDLRQLAAFEQDSFIVFGEVAEQLRAVVRMAPAQGAGGEARVELAIVGLTDRVEQELAELRGLYDIHVDLRLQPLLRQSSEWHDVLIETHVALRREFGWGVGLVIESESDYQRAGSSLVLRIIASGDARVSASRFHSFAASWWLDVPAAIRSRLQLDLRLVQD